MDLTGLKSLPELQAIIVHYTCPDNCSYSNIQRIEQTKCLFQFHYYSFTPTIAMKPPLSNPVTGSCSISGKARGCRRV